jgi:hypothetical protein
MRTTKAQAEWLAGRCEWPHDKLITALINDFAMLQATLVEANRLLSGIEIPDKIDGPVVMGFGEAQCLVQAMALIKATVEDCEKQDTVGYSDSDAYRVPEPITGEKA